MVAGVEVWSIEAEGRTFRLDAHRGSFRRSTTVTWFNSSVEVADQVTKSPSHRSNEPKHQVTVEWVNSSLR